MNSPKSSPSAASLQLFLLHLRSRRERREIDTDPWRPLPSFFEKREGEREERKREEMSKPKLLSRIMSIFSSKNQVGVDKAGNRYFTRTEEIDGVTKEKRWVIYKGERDPTAVPVEWICWLNGQRKKAPTPEELMELEARRERVKQNIELLKKKEEEERSYGAGQSKVIKKSDSPDLRSFMKQFPDLSPDQIQGADDAADPSVNTKTKERPSEPTGSGATFQPGTWQPPS